MIIGQNLQIDKQGKQQGACLWLWIGVWHKGIREADKSEPGNVNDLGVVAGDFLIQWCSGIIGGPQASNAPLRLKSCYTILKKVFSHPYILYGLSKAPKTRLWTLGFHP